MEGFIPEDYREEANLELDLVPEYDLEWLAILKVTDSLYYEGMQSALKKLSLDPKSQG